MKKNILQKVLVFALTGAMAMGMLSGLLSVVAVLSVAGCVCVVSDESAPVFPQPLSIPIAIAPVRLYQNRFFKNGSV